MSIWRTVGILLGVTAMGGGVYYLYKKKGKGIPLRTVGNITWTMIGSSEFTGRPGDYKIAGPTPFRLYLYHKGQRLPGIYYFFNMAMAAADRHYKAYVK